jgi:formylglycine-generating enzyme required for sulfatase activity
VLDAIAWYIDNTSEGFDPANKPDSSGADGEQDPHTGAGTRPVALKKANDWGLYDMLGNVWEWCADQWHWSYVGAPDDGAAWATPIGARGGAMDRVVRGGNWAFQGRGVRAAYRFHVAAGIKHDDLGFRCARVKSDNELPAAARRAGRN